MKNILCFGDSNTWGFIPGSVNPNTMQAERYDRNTRWTGLLQKLLGNKYYVIEEGLNGRTTNVEYKNRSGRNGKTYLLPCLFSHDPLDLVVLMLGANDLKKEFNNRSAKEIASGIGELIQLIQTQIYGPDKKSTPQVLVIGYPSLTKTCDRESADTFSNGIVRSKDFDKYYSEIAKKYSCHYFNSAEYIKLSEIDGVHLDIENHKIFSELIYKEIKKII